MEAVLDKEAAKKAAVGAAVQVTQGNVKGQAAVSALSAPGEDGSVTATIRLPGEVTWKEGMASAQITLSQTQHELCVPASSVGQDNQGYFVYLIEEKETVLGVQKLLVRTSVTIEERGTDTVAVSGALSQMDSVVSGSSKPLAASARVKVRG